MWVYGITTLLDKNINTFAHTHLIIKIPNQMHHMSWVYPCCALLHVFQALVEAFQSDTSENDFNTPMLQYPSGYYKVSESNVLTIIEDLFTQFCLHYHPLHFIQPMSFFQPFMMKLHHRSYQILRIFGRTLLTIMAASVHILSLKVAPISALVMRLLNRKSIRVSRS